MMDLKVNNLNNEIKGWNLIFLKLNFYFMYLEYIFDFVVNYINKNYKYYKLF